MERRYVCHKHKRMCSESMPKWWDVFWQGQWTFLRLRVWLDGGQLPDEVNLVVEEIFSLLKNFNLFSWNSRKKHYFFVHKNTNTASMLLKPHLQFIDDSQPTFRLLIVSVYTKYGGPRRVPTIFWMCNPLLLISLIYHPILVRGLPLIKKGTISSSTVLNPQL